jgi:3'(2'), 5'-bisphosphate nucleotidase
MNRELTPFLQDLCGLAEKAGAEAMRFYGRASVTLKQDSSPLTDADRASHETIVQALPNFLSGIPVVSEESAEPATALPANGRFWLVDPLDGTKEFLKGTGEFTVNIALIENARPILGVVHAPAIGLSYFASLGHGSFRQHRGQPATPIFTIPANLQRPRVVASKDHAGPLVEKMLSRLPGAELKSIGSSLKFCLVAAGEADIYLRDVPTMEWDTAAAQCVVEAAGGTLCTLDGQPLRYGKPGLKNGSIITVGDLQLNWSALL